MSGPVFRGSMLVAMLASGWGPYNLVRKKAYESHNQKKSRIPYPIYERTSGFAGIPRSTGIREHTESDDDANILLNNKRPDDTHHTSAFRHFDISNSPQV